MTSTTTATRTHLGFLKKTAVQCWKALESLFILSQHDPYGFSDITGAASLEDTQEKLKFRGVIQPFQLVKHPYPAR